MNECIVFNDDLKQQDVTSYVWWLFEVTFCCFKWFS